MGGGSAGSYDDQCLRWIDRLRKPDFCILFAAGNDGRDGKRTAPSTWQRQFARNR